MDRSTKKYDDKLPTLYSVLLCEVSRIQQYGAFVKMPGYRSSGLVHKSQMSKVYIEDPEDAVSVGDRVYCKVISIDDDGKIGLSMKFVNQTTGKDEDSNNVHATMVAQRRRTVGRQENRKIELGAVLDTTCRKCGGKGHMAIDCFHVPGSASYELLTDDIDPVTPAADEPSIKVVHKAHKHKKHKKDKKREDGKRKSVVQKSSDEDEQRTKIKKHKHHRHHIDDDTKSKHRQTNDEVTKSKHRQTNDEVTKSKHRQTNDEVRHSIDEVTKSKHRHSIDDDTKSKRRHSIDDDTKSKHRHSIDDDTKSKHRHSIDDDTKSKHRHSIDDDIKSKHRHRHSIDDDTKSKHRHSSDEDMKSRHRH